MPPNQLRAPTAIQTLLEPGRNELEARAAKRTAELTRTNEALRLEAEIARRARAEEERDQLRSELARVARVMTLGELTASIAHEIKQPIATASNNARAALNFLDKSPPDLAEVSAALTCIVDDTDRARDVMDRIGSLIKKTPSRREVVDVLENDLRRCRAEWEAQRRIGDFPLGERDTPDRPTDSREAVRPTTRGRDLARLLRSRRRLGGDSDRCGGEPLDRPLGAMFLRLVLT
jgi:signal transduction histidine kinase